MLNLWLKRGGSLIASGRTDLLWLSVEVLAGLSPRQRSSMWFSGWRRHCPRYQGASSASSFRKPSSVSPRTDRAPLMSLLNLFGLLSKHTKAEKMLLIPLIDQNIWSGFRTTIYIRDNHFHQGQPTLSGTNIGIRGNHLYQGQTLGSGTNIRVRDNHLDQGQLSRSGKIIQIRDNHLDQRQPLESGTLISIRDKHQNQEQKSGSGTTKWIKGNHRDQGQPSGSGINIWIWDNHLDQG